MSVYNKFQDGNRIFLDPMEYIGQAPTSYTSGYFVIRYTLSDASRGSQLIYHMSTITFTTSYYGWGSTSTYLTNRPAETLTGSITIWGRESYDEGGEDTYIAYHAFIDGAVNEYVQNNLRIYYKVVKDTTGKYVYFFISSEGYTSLYIDKVMLGPDNSSLLSKRNLIRLNKISNTEAAEQLIDATKLEYQYTMYNDTNLCLKYFKVPDDRRRNIYLYRKETGNGGDIYCIFYTLSWNNNMHGIFYIRSGSGTVNSDFEVFPIAGSQTAIALYTIEKITVDGRSVIHIQFTGTYQGRMDFLFIPMFPELHLAYELVTT